MRVRIESDGSVMGTRVVNEATGEPLQFVRSVRFVADAERSDLAFVTIELVKVPVRFVAKARLKRAKLRVQRALGARLP